MPWLGGLTSAFGHCVNFKRRRRAYTVKDDEEQLPDKLVTLILFLDADSDSLSF